MRTVRIPPGKSGGAIPDPEDVFDALLPEAATLVWALSDADWVVAKEGSPLNVDRLQGEVAAGRSGLVLGWAELRGLLDNVLQVIDGTFVACHDRESIPPRSADHEELVGKAEMVVTAFDSSYWLVTAPDPVVARLIDRFPGTETV